MTDEEYGHHRPGYDPRGPDFDPPHTPEREARMRTKEDREGRSDPCPVCGEQHERK